MDLITLKLAEKYTDKEIEELSIADKIKLNSPNFNSTNVKDGMEELFTSVSNGKDLLVTAIADKNIQVPSDPTFEDLADIISRELTIPYTLATDEDFSGTSNGQFRYIGTDKYVEIPHVIKGVNVTSYRSMFQDTDVKGVKSTNKNVTDMSWMFQNSQATTLDLSSFDTSNVTIMSNMFYGSQATTLDLSSFDTSNVTFMSDMFRDSQATTLDLSSFDTSNVTIMSYMFRDSQATTLDLSSFDTSNVTNMYYMFSGSQATTLDLSSFDTSSVTTMGSMFLGSQATTGYARTQADADKFNASSNKPSGLNFVVK